MVVDTESADFTGRNSNSKRSLNDSLVHSDEQHMGFLRRRHREWLDRDHALRNVADMSPGSPERGRSGGSGKDATKHEPVVDQGALNRASARLSADMVGFTIEGLTELKDQLGEGSLGSVAVDFFPALPTDKYLDERLRSLSTDRRNAALLYASVRDKTAMSLDGLLIWYLRGDGEMSPDPDALSLADANMELLIDLSTAFALARMLEAAKTDDPARLALAFRLAAVRLGSLEKDLFDLIVGDEPLFSSRGGLENSRLQRQRFVDVADDGKVTLVESVSAYEWSRWSNAFERLLRKYLPVEYSPDALDSEFQMRQGLGLLKEGEELVGILKQRKHVGILREYFFLELDSVVPRLIDGREKTYSTEGSDGLGITIRGLSAEQLEALDTNDEQTTSNLEHLEPNGQVTARADEAGDFDPPDRAALLRKLDDVPTDQARHSRSAHQTERSGESKRNVGLEVVGAIFDLMQIDKQWSEWDEHGFTWWPGPGAAQRIWTDPVLQDNGFDVYRLQARTELMDGFEATDPKVEFLEALNAQSTLSALVELPAGSISLASSMYVDEKTADWARRLFALVTAMQAADAYSFARTMAGPLGARVLESAHPSSGKREDMDDMLNILETFVLPAGTTESVWAGTEMISTLTALQEQFLATGDESGLTVEFPFQSQTSLLEVQTDVTHPSVGHGMLMLLRLPLTSTSAEAARVSHRLNQQMIELRPSTNMLGAWCATNDDVTHTSFFPNAAHFGSADILNLVMSAGTRARWVAEAIYGDDWEKNRDKHGRWLAKTAFEQLLEENPGIDLGEGD